MVAADHSLQPRKKVGVVIIVCREVLARVMFGFSCEDTQYYVYKKCDHEIQHTAVNSTPTIRQALLACTKFYRVTKTENVSKIHSDYLAHIVNHWDELEQRMVFFKGAKHGYADLTTCGSPICVTSYSIQRAHAARQHNALVRSWSPADTLNGATCLVNGLQVRHEKYFGYIGFSQSYGASKEVRMKAAKDHCLQVYNQQMKLIP
eukprot:4583450-Pyramimonas_sp.AAC.1